MRLSLLLLSPGQTDSQVDASERSWTCVDTCVGWPNRLSSLLTSTCKSQKKTFQDYGLGPARQKFKPHRKQTKGWMLATGKGKRLLVWFLIYYARKTIVELNEERQEIGLRGSLSKGKKRSKKTSTTVVLTLSPHFYGLPCRLIKRRSESEWMNEWNLYLNHGKNISITIENNEQIHLE